MKKRGFTLIELLAVIVIIAIISLIAVPFVLNVIDKAKRGVFEDNIKISSRQIDKYLYENDLSDIPDEGIDIKDMNIKSDFKSGQFKRINGVITAYFIKNDNYCAYGEIDKLIIKTDCDDLDLSYPTIDETKLVISRTSNSIKISILEGFAKDDESSISSYKIIVYNGKTKIKTKQLTDIGSLEVADLIHNNEYKIEIIVTNGNNISSTLTENVKTLEISVPTYEISPTTDEKLWTSRRTVTINYPSGYTNEYSLDGGKTWKPYTDSIVFNKIGTVIARVNDGKNYVTGSSQTVAGIDSDKPTSSTFTYTRTSNSITVMAIGTDATSTISGYAFSKDNGSTWTSKQVSNEYKFNGLLTGKYKIVVRVYDQVDNYLDSDVKEVDTLEIGIPTYEINPTTDEKLWTSSRTVTINYPVGYTNEYSLDGGETWKSYTGPITFNKIGTVIARVNDGKNYVTGSSQTVAGIDSDKPTSSTFTYTRTSKSIFVMASGTDATSTISGYAFSKDNGSTWTSKQVSNEYEFNDLLTGTYKIKVRVYDQVGNYLDSEAKEIGTVVIPTPTYEINPTTDEKLWALSRTVTINYPSGYTNEYSLDGGSTWKPYTGPVAFVKNGTVIARVNDGKNYVTGSSQTIIGIDSDKPTSSTFTYTRTSNSITAIASGTDATSSISGYAFSKDNGSTWTSKQSSNNYTFTSLATGKYKIKVRVYDQAGNYLDSDTKEVETVSISAPTYSVSPENGWAISKTVTINYPSGYTNEYSLDGGNTWKSYTAPVVLTDIGATSITVVGRVNDGKNYVTGSTLTVADIYLTRAENVSFTPDDSNWNVDNVYEALEDLYNSL